MFQYKSEIEIKEIIIKINNNLSEIEVKGNGVEHIFLSKVALKNIFDNLIVVENIEENKPEEKKEEN